MSALILRLREIGTALPTTDEAGLDMPATEAATPSWHDSTLDLERGLDVLELPIEPVEPASRAEPPGAA